jgi:hypothetical protein
MRNDAILPPTLSSDRTFCQNSALKLKFVPNFAMHIGAFVLGTLMLDVIPTAKNRVEH